MPVTADDLEQEFQEEQAKRAKVKAARESEVSESFWVSQWCKRLLIVGMICAVVMLIAPPAAWVANADASIANAREREIHYQKERRSKSDSHTELPNAEAMLINKDEATKPGARTESPAIPAKRAYRPSDSKPQFGGFRCSTHPRGVSSWRDAIPVAMKDIGLNASGDIYEFGVFDGGSMFMLKKFFPHSKMWGFDSFEGLPKTQDDFVLGEWTPGSFKASRTVDELTRKLGGKQQVQFVVGFFEKTLTPSLRERFNMPPAFYIDMDADLYISSIQVLDWVFSNGIARVGTLIGYDDFWVSPCARGGEKLSPLNTSAGKAHAEASERYRVKFKCVAGACGIRSCTKNTCCWGPIFLIEAIGGETVPDNGFHMSEKEIQTWKNKNMECRQHHAGWAKDLTDDLKISERNKGR